MSTFHDKHKYWISRFLALTSFALFATSSLIAVLPSSASVISSYPDVHVAPTPLDKPQFSSYKGVTLGITADAARKLLGKAQDQSNEQDLYVFSDNETAQVYFDSARLVMAISVTYSGDLTAAPTAKTVLGETIPAKSDGGIFKLVRYPKAGCWVSYSRSTGDNPTISITIQKI